MRTGNTFLIESEVSRHRLLLNGREISTFATLEAAEAEASKIAERAVPGAALRFELDFKWTLTDLEIRAATLGVQERKDNPMTNDVFDRKEAVPCGS